MKNIFKMSILCLAFFTFINQAFVVEAIADDKITLLTPKQAQEYIETTEGFYLLDVRTKEEYAEKRLAGSTLIPLDALPSRLNEIPKDKDILIHCLGGVRAQKAADIIAPTIGNTSKIFVLDGFTIYN